MTFDPEQAKRDGKCQVRCHDKWRDAFLSTVDGQRCEVVWASNTFTVPLGQVRNIPPELPEKLWLKIGAMQVGAFAKGFSAAITAGPSRGCMVDPDPNEIILEVPIPADLEVPNE